MKRVRIAGTASATCWSVRSARGISIITRSRRWFNWCWRWGVNNCPHSISSNGTCWIEISLVDDKRGTTGGGNWKRENLEGVWVMTPLEATLLFAWHWIDQQIHHSFKCCLWGCHISISRIFLCSRKNFCYYSFINVFCFFFN